jgi:alanine racemase
VVKADAYGIGIEPAVGSLWRAGCRTFFVAHLSEAARVRAVAPEAVIYVLNGLQPGTAARYRELGLRPVLGSMPEIREWAEFCGGTKLPAALHVDTGMNRLGLTPAEAIALARDAIMSAFEPALLMSHLAASEEPSQPINGRQVATFLAVAAEYPGVPASLANSSGVFLADSFPQMRGLALARPGYALYGGNPTPDQPNPMRPVVRLDARIIQVREIEAGAKAGYNETWTAARPSRLSTLSIGYADGYPRSASGTDAAIRADLPVGAALVAGRLCPFVGRVSMDLIILDVTDVPEREVSRGDPAVLIGGPLDINEVGRRAGTIGYEILTNLGRRYARRYVQD